MTQHRASTAIGTRAIWSLTIGAMLLVLSSIAEARERETRMGHLISLGTASTSGTFWPVGVGLCRQINAIRLTTGVRCIAYTTGGSVYNIQAIRSGQLNMGIVRSDLATNAFYGLEPFERWGPYRDLRVVGVLYDMPVSIIVRSNAGISQLSDMRGKRINIGRLGSGQRPLVEKLIESVGLTLADFRSVRELTTDEMGNAFCRGQLDVIVEAIGHPAPFYRRIIDQCGGAFLRLSESDLLAITSAEPRIRRSTIPGGIYRRSPQPVPTIGFYATLVSASTVPTNTIEAVSTSVSRDLSGFFGIDPNVRATDIGLVNQADLGVPLHEGAAALQSLFQRIRVKSDAQQ